MKMTKPRFLILICLCFSFAAAAFSQNPDPKLIELRRQFAINYLKPEAHFALARYYFDKADKVQAFYIMEYARRHRFPEEVFDAAFPKYFGDNWAEPDNKAKDAFEEGYRLLKEGKTDEAEQSLVKAANLAPRSFYIHGWVGRFFFKVRQDNAKALPYYFNSYFLYPHAYETEYVESRIRNITFADAETRFAELIKTGKTPEQILADTNPLIVGMALGQMAKQWKKEYVKFMLEAMSNDDSGVRWYAFQILYKNADASFDETLTALMKDSDLRKRGLAAYAIVERWKEKRFEILKKMLADQAELIRFDGVSALILHAGEPGLAIVRQHRKVETSPRLKELIDLELQKKPGENR